MVECYIPEYPRPQFVRTDWQLLNGTWQFAFDDTDVGIFCRWFEQFPNNSVQIHVPFSPECPASGIGRISEHVVAWYERNFSVETQDDKRVILHFEAVDYYAQVWVNGMYVGKHSGGYNRFSIDITDSLHNGENKLTVRVEDTNARWQPRGKQRWKTENYICWYTSISGIWKTVWLEFCPSVHLDYVQMIPSLENRAVNIKWSLAGCQLHEATTLTVKISFEGTLAATVTCNVSDLQGSLLIPIGSTEIDPWGIKKWSPDHPNLYDIIFELCENGSPVDRVQSYLGMREISTANGQIFLNGELLQQHLVLDQGYWADTYLTPPNENAIIADIDHILRFGFNGARKHQKIEDERYYFWCDVKGLLTWCEMPSPHEFCEKTMEALTTQWAEVLNQYYNHPSIIVWTPLNESWGVPDIKSNVVQQNFAQSIYYLTKAIDPTRLVVLNDGWEQTVTDIVTIHDYLQNGERLAERYTNYMDQVLEGDIRYNVGNVAFAQGFSYQGQPILMSEYGGARLEKDQDNTFGYGRVLDSDIELVNKIEELTDAVMASTRICGFCYTQLTDVFQEQNGLLTMERKCKADPALLHPIFSRNK